MKQLSPGGDFTVQCVFEVITTLYLEVYLRLCVSAGECGKLFIFFIKLVRYQKFMCFCEFKNRVSFFDVDSIPMIGVTITCIVTNLTYMSVQVNFN